MGTMATQQKLTPQQIAAYVRQAGFSGPMVPIMTAIAMAESGANPRAHNGNAGTGDNSYGLFQINMLGGMGPSRRKALGISSNEQLFDPATNARAAYLIYKQQGLNAWSVYKHGTYAKFLGQATQAANGAPVDVPGEGTTPIPADETAGDGVGITDALAVVPKAVLWVGKPRNLIRVAEALIGGGLILAGAILVARPVVQPVIQQAAAVATPVGRVATLARKVAA